MHKRLFFRMRSLLATGGTVTHEGKTPFVIYPKAQRPRRLVIRGRCETADGTLRCVGVYAPTSKQYTVPLLYTSPQGEMCDASVSLQRPLYGVDGFACDELNVTGGRLTVRTECINLSDVRESITVYGHYHGRLIYAYRPPVEDKARADRNCCVSSYFTVCPDTNTVGATTFSCATAVQGQSLIFTLDEATNTLEDAKAYLKGRDARIVYVRAEEKVLPYRGTAARLLSPACSVSLREEPQTTVSLTYLPCEEV